MNETAARRSGALPTTMKAVRVHGFGGVDTMSYEDVERPSAGDGQVVARVKAAGVGPWDALIRSGGSGIPQPLPLTLGSDLAGIVADVGPGVSAFREGDEVFGVTNSRFTGAYAEYAVAEAGMIARKPPELTFAEAASVLVVAVTAWTMVFDYGHLDRTKRALIQGAAGNVGACGLRSARARRS